MGFASGLLRLLLRLGRAWPAVRGAAVMFRLIFGRGFLQALALHTGIFLAPVVLTVFPAPLLSVDRGVPPDDVAEA